MPYFAHVRLHYKLYGWDDLRDSHVYRWDNLLSVPQCDADPSVTKNAVQEDKYENILTLIGYYDIETRTPIRLLMLQIFGVLCGLDKAIVSILLSSILPNELGRDIQDNLTGWDHSQCIQIHIHVH